GHRRGGGDGRLARPQGFLALSFYRLDPANQAEYAQEVTRWQEIEIQRDYLGHFPDLLARRRFFLIFADYFRFTQFWGLDTDVASREIDERLRVEPVSRKAIVDDWERKGAGKIGRASCRERE